MAPMSNSDLNSSHTIQFNGETVTVPANTTDITAFIKAENKRRGIVTFVAIIDGREVNSVQELQAAFDSGNTLEIRTYAKPGLHC